MKRRHEYSQHFLRRPALVKELIGHSNIKKTDTVVDIGAGSGIISSALASRAAHVIAIENETRTVEKLRENTAAFANVKILHASILDAPLPDAPHKILANIPFHLSAAIVRRLTSTTTPPTDIYLIVQLQFAKKLLIDSDQFTGMLGAQLSPWWAAKIRRTLKRTDFWPHPNVDTAFIHLSRREDQLLPRTLQTDFCSFVERCFHDQVYFSALDIAQLLHTRKRRPSELSSQEWVALFRSLHSLAK